MPYYVNLFVGNEATLNYNNQKVCLKNGNQVPLGW
jgi:hypothetical protein